MKKEYAAPEVEIIKFTPDRSIMDFEDGTPWQGDDIKEDFNPSNNING